MAYGRYSDLVGAAAAAVNPDAPAAVDAVVVVAVEAGAATITVDRTGDIANSMSVDYVVNAGTATASYTYVGDDNHTGSSDSNKPNTGNARVIF